MKNKYIKDKIMTFFLITLYTQRQLSYARRRLLTPIVNDDWRWQLL